jgi:lysyl endopeptidase
MKIAKACASLFLLGLFTAPSWAQIDRGLTPSRADVTTFESLRMDDIDRVALGVEDAILDAEKENAWRFGVEHEVQLSPATDGTWTEENGMRVWRLGVHCPEAITVGFFLDKYRLPKGARLFVYDAESDAFIGSFDHRNNKSWGKLPVRQLSGSHAVLEYHEPLNAEFEGELAIGKVIHGYRALGPHADDVFESFNRGPYGNSGACNINVNCPEGAPWATESRSVVLILSGGWASCTGAMLNNTAQDGTPYFLTANHCLGNPQNWTYLFNHESEDCDDNSSAPITDTVAGGDLKASNGGSDFALIELSESPPASYNVQYAGWDNTDNDPTSVVGIHHPSGDVKMICFDTDGAYQANSGGAAVWWIDQWEDGVTEPGSSGSPLFDQDHRVVGQLYGGAAACSGSNNNGQYDFYGRFGESWDGASASSRLRDWLDPFDSGTSILDGWPDGAVSYELDAGAGVQGLPEGFVCGEGSYQAEVVITNMGTDNLTGATINWSANGGAINSQSWTGDLAQYESDIALLPWQSYIQGNNTIEVSVTLPNGTYDENDMNNAAIGEFTAYLGETFDFHLKLILDDYGSETTWELRQLGQVFYSGGPYADDVDGEQVDVDFCLQEGCYQFRMYDSYGDGMCCGYGEGNYTLFDPEWDMIFTGGEFTEQANEDFCTDDMGVAEGGSKTTWQLGPNPASDRIVLSTSGEFEGSEIRILDVSGRVVLQQAWSGELTTIDLGDWPSGLYMVSCAGLVKQLVIRR